ncbi:MAG: imidazole glycerol phosphate synthase subunit HisH [Magnetococcales bacterium]|nr:imidazole glycerol phosphate synthase subunit HisH [Magnetococcales bacterium]
MTALIIDYGMGNLGSVRRSLEECGADVVISRNPSDLDQASHVVLPGVGAFQDGMKRLTESGWPEAIRKTALDEGVPFLGICLGMQLLATTGSEGGTTSGLNLIPGHVIRFETDDPEIRIPHVGWNEVHFSEQTYPFEEIPSGGDFYFVHSFHFQPDNAESIAATTPYCGEFVSVVRNNLIVGTQFHPEKSSRYGRQLLNNFLAL